MKKPIFKKNEIKALFVASLFLTTPMTTMSVFAEEPPPPIGSEPPPEPIFEPEPISDPDPVFDPDPIFDPDPTSDPDPVFDTDPILDPDPVFDPDPTSNPDPVFDPDPISDPDSDDWNNPPPNGEDGQPPPNGEDEEPPPNGEDGQPPPNGEDGQPPPNGEDGQPPPNGEDGEPPPNGEDGQPPPNGEDGQPPPNGEDGQPPPLEPDPDIDYVNNILDDPSMTNEQLTEAMDALTPEQISRLLDDPRLTGEEIGRIANELDLTEMDQIFDDPDLSADAPAKILVQLDPNRVQINDMQGILPEGWEIEEDGDLRPPPGARFSLPPKLPPADMPSDFDMPDDMPDFEKALALGGQNTAGRRAIDAMNEAAEFDESREFSTFEQDERGFLKAQSGGNRNFNFMPDPDGMEQVGEDEPVGVSRNAGGFPMVTTPERQRYKLTPAPHDPSSLSTMFDQHFGENTHLKLDDEGDVLAALPRQDSGEYDYYSVIFDAEIETAPEGAPEGIYSEGSDVFIVYPDRTAQKVKPTIFLPDTFIDIGLKFDGVEEVVYNVDGTIKVLYRGIPLIIEPDFNIQVTDLSEDETFESEIIPQIERNRVVYRLYYEDEVEDATKGVRSSRRKRLDYDLPIRCEDGEGSECLE